MLNFYNLAYFLLICEFRKATERIGVGPGYGKRGVGPQ